MLKWIRIGIHAFFPLTLSTSHCKRTFLKHKEKYSIEERYAYIHKLAVKLNKGTWHAKFYITGEENLKKAPGQVLFTPNHNSKIDPLAFLTYADRPISFLAKAQILKMPYMGVLVSSIDASFIDREDIRSEIKVFRQINDLLEKEPSLSYVVYPEGTRSKGPDFNVAEFKGGSFKIATRLDLPIIPVATYLNARITDQRYHYHTYPVQVAYLEPIMPEDYQGMTTGQIAAIAQKRIEEALVKMKEKDLELIMECNHYSEKKARKVQLVKEDKKEKRS